MATSNSYDFTMTRDELIGTSFELIGVGVEGETLQSEDVAVANRALNMMIKAWKAHGLQVWKRKEYSLSPLVLNKQYYDLGVYESQAIVLAGDGATSVATLAYHGFQVGDSVLIASAADANYNGTQTITAITPSTFSYASTGSGADTGTSTLQTSMDIPKPERILDIDLIDTSGNELPMTQISRDEFSTLPNKTTAGTPVNYHYERTLGAGRLYVWPVADASAVTNYTVDILYQAPIEDADSGTDHLDFPSEWLEALSYNLAIRLAPRYGGLSVQESAFLIKFAEEALNLAKDYDVEDDSLFLQPE